MTLDERALAHGRAALASPDAEKYVGAAWQGWRVIRFEDEELHELHVMQHLEAFDLAAVMYAQDVAEGRHT